jgi:hypothetical protein
MMIRKQKHGEDGPIVSTGKATRALHFFDSSMGRRVSNEL